MEGYLRCRVGTVPPLARTLEAPPLQHGRSARHGVVQGWPSVRPQRPHPQCRAWYVLLGVRVKLASLKNVGPPHTHQEIKRLRREVGDMLRRYGQPVAYFSAWNLDDVIAGEAKRCPAC